MLDHRRLSYFLAVAAERSFTRASERLHIAQPALSRQVRLLEDELGGRLLVRGGPDGITTTPAGALLVAQAPGILAQLERLEEEAARLAGAAREGRTLRLGYAASAAHGAAPPILAALHDLDPDLTVQARVMCTADALDGLHDGTLEAAILRVPTGTDGLSSLVVRREVQGVVLRADHPLARSPSVPIAALRASEIVIHPRHANPGRYDEILAVCRGAGFEPTLIEPLLAFDPTHAMITGTDRVTFVSDPGSVIPAGLTWRPVAPALVLDVVLLTPLVASGPTANLVAAAQSVAEASGWLEEPPAPLSLAG